MFRPNASCACIWPNNFRRNNGSAKACTVGVVRLVDFRTRDNDTLGRGKFDSRLQPMVELIVENAKAVRFFVQGPESPRRGWVRQGRRLRLGSQLGSPEEQ